MKLRDALGWQQTPVVLGVFHNTDELFQACAVLTDFGYPKELARVSRIETIMPINKTKLMNTLIRYVTVTNILIALLVIAMVTIATVFVAELPLTAYGHTAEVIFTLMIGVAFFSAGSLACMLIGYLIWTLVGTFLAYKNNKGSRLLLAKSFCGRVVVRIKAHNQTDAEEIAQAWTEIGGRVLEPSKPQTLRPSTNQLPV